MNEHEYEPIPGLPAHLPKGETILWQGAPDFKAFAREAMRVRVVAGYFGILAIWGIASRLSSHMPPYDVALATLKLAGMATVAIALLCLYAWLVARTTVYTITSRRVVMRFGVALPLTIQIAYPMIESAGLQTGPDGSGTIALTLLPGQRVGYLIVWPHARPWRLAKAQPALRCVPDGTAVAQILGRALAASAAQPAKAVADVAAPAGGRVHIPAAA